MSGRLHFVGRLILAGRPEGVAGTACSRFFIVTASMHVYLLSGNDSVSLNFIKKPPPVCVSAPETLFGFRQNGSLYAVIFTSLSK